MDAGPHEQQYKEVDVATQMGAEARIIRLSKRPIGTDVANGPHAGGRPDTCPHTGYRYVRASKHPNCYSTTSTNLTTLATEPRQACGANKERCVADGPWCEHANPRARRPVNTSNGVNERRRVVGELRVLSRCGGSHTTPLNCHKRAEWVKRPG